MPELRQLYDYWLERCAGRVMPHRKDIHPSHFPRLLPGISLLEARGDEGRCCIRLAGTRLREIYDREITGLYVDELDWGDKRDYWLATYDRALNEAKPVQGVLRAPRHNKEHLVQHWLRLPLALDETGRPRMLLSLDCFMAVNSYSSADLPRVEAATA